MIVRSHPSAALFRYLIVTIVGAAVGCGSPSESPSTLDSDLATPSVDAAAPIEGGPGSGPDSGAIPALPDGGNPLGLVDSGVPIDGGAAAPADAGDTQSKEACTTRYEAGHGDMFAVYDDTEDRLFLQIRSHLEFPGPGGPDPLHDPEGICIVVPQSSFDSIQAAGGRPTFGDPDAFSPIGVPAGASFWILESRNLGAAQPYWGVATEGVSTTSFTSAVDFEFISIDRPEGGDLSVYSLPFLPVFHVSSRNPERTEHGRNVIRMLPGGHDHFNWTFSSPGVYAVRVRPFITRPGGGRLIGEAATFNFVVEGS